MAITLGKDSFEVPTPPAWDSWELQQRVLPVFGRVAGAVLHFLGRAPDHDLEKLKEVDVMEVLPAVLPHLGAIFSEMPPGEFGAISRALLRNATMNGMPLFTEQGNPYDALMRGRTMDTWRLLVYALRVWYPDFFGYVVGRLGNTGGKESRTAA
jgi:hypothetical protein